MRNTSREVVEHRARPLDVDGLAAEQRQELALAHGRDRAHDRRIDQARTRGLDDRCQLAMRHWLQRAHLDEQLALDVTGEESVGPGEDLPHALVLGDDGEHHVDFARHRARPVDHAQAALDLRLARLFAAIPCRHLAAALGQALPDRRAHAPETDQSDFHFGDSNRVIRRMRHRLGLLPLP
jgi:hypothetical protein